MLKSYFYKDNPSLAFILPLIIQASIIGLFNFAFFLLIFRAAHVSQTMIVGHLQWILIAYCIAVTIQCFRFIRIGSGYFLPATTPAVYFGAAIIAAQQGGYPLLIGMMVFAGVCEIIFAFVFRHIRAIFPKEVVGLAIFIVGLQIGVIAFQSTFQHNAHYPTILLLIIALTSIAIVAVWGTPRTKNLGLIVGSIVGTACMLIFPNFFGTHWRAGPTIPLSWFGWPAGHALFPMHVDFKLALMPVFIFSALAGALRTIGMLTIAKRYEDQCWKRPDQRLIRKSILADGISCVISGFCSGLGLSSAPVTTTLAVNAKCTSRWLPLGIILIYFVFAWFPRIIDYLARMPTELIGIVLFYYAITMLVSGLKIMQPEKFEAREMFSIGLPIVFVATIFAYPAIYEKLPTALYELIINPLSSGIILSALLTAIFYIKSHKKLLVKIDQGRATTRKKVIAQFNEYTESLRLPQDNTQYLKKMVKTAINKIFKEGLAEKNIAIQYSANKLNLDVAITYQGKPLRLASIPGNKLVNLLEDDSVTYGLEHYFKNFFPDKIKISSEGHDCQIKFSCALQ